MGSQGCSVRSQGCSVGSQGCSVGPRGVLWGPRGALWGPRDALWVPGVLCGCPGVLCGVSGMLCGVPGVLSGVPHQLGPSTGTLWECLVPILAARSALPTQSKALQAARDEFLGWFPPRGLDAGCFLRNTLFPAFLGPPAWHAVPLPAKPSWSLLSAAARQLQPGAGALGVILCWWSPRESPEPERPQRGRLCRRLPAPVVTGAGAW